MQLKTDTQYGRQSGCFIEMVQGPGVLKEDVK